MTNSTGVKRVRNKKNAKPSANMQAAPSISNVDAGKSLKNESPMVLPEVVKEDPYLEPYTQQIAARCARANATERALADAYGAGKFDAAVRAHETRYGFVPPSKGSDGAWMYREYAPGAEHVCLAGDFNDWSRTSHELRRCTSAPGDWEIRLPVPPPNGSYYKVAMRKPDSGELFDRISPWARRVIQRKDGPSAGLFCPVFYAEDYLVTPPGFASSLTGHEPTQAKNVSNFTPCPYDLSSVLQNQGTAPEVGQRDSCSDKKSLAPFVFRHPRRPWSSSQRLRIYECHVGIATEEPRIGTYREFRERVLPHIAAMGYNALQIMGIMEHAYYASFGYHVTSFFAPSSRFGNPDELRQLVDAAHGYGFYVLLDVVHSHASKNVDDGLNNFDGTDHCYFHAEWTGRAIHPAWDSRLFDYASLPTLRFLLSNVAYWMDCFGFDGFRFDGVTSMLYVHHGVGVGFSGAYHEYFNDIDPFKPASPDSAFAANYVDEDAITYLVLANTVVHSRHGISIAEDVSGMPTLARPRSAGGIGFDFRLAMAAPDVWIKVLREMRDEDWPLGHIIHTLTNHRATERVVAYAEGHDQALVGDKTIAFWLMDRYMYTHMSRVATSSGAEHEDGQARLAVDRGIALHKMIRLFTFLLGGGAWLTFMGNEFGHPEWLDFPRVGNGDSYHYARRQWGLLRDHNLRYNDLCTFERDMLRMDVLWHILDSYPQRHVSRVHDGDRVVAFDIGSDFVCVFNWNPSTSFSDYRIGAPAPGSYRIVLDTDASAYGGHTRLDDSMEYPALAESPFANRPSSLMLYLPSRSAQVYRRVC